MRLFRISPDHLLLIRNDGSKYEWRGNASYVDQRERDLRVLLAELLSPVNPQSGMPAYATNSPNTHQYDLQALSIPAPIHIPVPSGYMPATPMMDDDEEPLPLPTLNFAEIANLPPSITGGIRREPMAPVAAGEEEPLPVLALDFAAIARGNR